MDTTAGYRALFFSEQRLPELVVRPYHARVLTQDEYPCDSLSTHVVYKGKAAGADNPWDIFLFSSAC
jgi:hypothetical protein